MNRCPRCGGLLCPDELGDRYCLACGEGVYRAIDDAVDVLVEVIQRQEVRDHARQVIRGTRTDGRRWDAPVGSTKRRRRAERAGA